MDENWTDEQIVGMRAKLAEAKRQGIFLSAIEARMFLALLTWWQRSTMRGYRRPHDGMAPTVGDVRAQGVTHLFVWCAKCGATGSSRRIALDDLYMPPGRQPVPDHAVFTDLPNLCRFRCTRCGSRRVTLLADRPTGMAIGYRGPDPTKGGLR